MGKWKVWLSPTPFLMGLPPPPSTILPHLFSSSSGLSPAQGSQDIVTAILGMGLFLIPHSKAQEGTSGTGFWQNPDCCV